MPKAKSAKKADDLTVFFSLLGSSRLKVTRKMLVKSTQGEGESKRQ